MEPLDKDLNSRIPIRFSKETAEYAWPPSPTDQKVKKEAEILRKEPDHLTLGELIFRIKKTQEPQLLRFFTQRITLPFLESLNLSSTSLHRSAKEFFVSNPFLDSLYSEMTLGEVAPFTSKYKAFIIFNEGSPFHGMEFGELGQITQREWNFLHLNFHFKEIAEKCDPSTLLKDFLIGLVASFKNELEWLRGLDHLSPEILHNRETLLFYYKIDPQKVKAYVQTLSLDVQRTFSTRYPYLVNLPQDEVNSSLEPLSNQELRDALEPDMSLFPKLSSSLQLKIVNDVLEECKANHKHTSNLLLYPPNWTSVINLIPQESFYKLIFFDETLQNLFKTISQRNPFTLFEWGFNAILEAAKPENAQWLRNLFQDGNQWKLCIDPKHRQFGPLVYDLGLHGKESESGYLQSMQFAWLFIVMNCLSKEPQPLDMRYYNSVNSLALSHRKHRYLANSEIYLAGLKTKDLVEALKEDPDFFIKLKKTCPWIEWETIEQIFDKAKNQPWHLPEAVNLYFKSQSRLEIEEEVLEAFHRYEKSSKSLSDLAELHQQLERRHYYADGNTRTHLLLLQEELIKQGKFVETLEPNYSYFQTLRQWTEKIEESLQFLTGRNAPSTKMTVENYRNELLQNSKKDFHIATLEVLQKAGIFNKKLGEFGIISLREWNYIDLSHILYELSVSEPPNTPIEDLILELLEAKKNDLQTLRELNSLTVNTLKDRRKVATLFALNPERLTHFMHTLSTDTQMGFCARYPFLVNLPLDVVNAKLQPLSKKELRAIIEQDPSLFPQLEKNLQLKVIEHLLDECQKKRTHTSSLLLFPPNWRVVQELVPNEFEDLLMLGDKHVRFFQVLSQYGITNQWIMEAFTQAHKHKDWIEKLFENGNWKLCIDPRDHLDGPLVYDLGLHGSHKEPGYLLSMKLAWVFIVLNTISQNPLLLDFTFYDMLHALTLSHSEISEPASTDVYIRKLPTSELLEALQDDPKFLEKLGLQTPWLELPSLALDQPSSSFDLRFKFTDPAISKEIVTQSLSQYNSSSKSLEDLANLHQFLERRHYYADGNSRTHLLLLQSELLKERRYTVIDPNGAYVKTPNAWTKTIENGLVSL